MRRPPVDWTLAIGVPFLLIAATLLWILRGPGSDVVVRPPDGSFVPSGARSRAEIWAVGDGADAGLAGASVTRLIERGAPDRVLYLGDVYEDGTREEFEENYAPTFGRLAAITAPTLGNHEAPNADRGYEPYWGDVYGRTPPSFYSFELAGWEMLSLNSEIDYGTDSDQVRWIRRQTREGGDCRLAFWHRPRYSAGTNHGDDPSLQPLWDALEGRARLIVNGHEHDMQRLAPRQGMIELIAGAGGRSSYPIDRGYDGLRFGDDRLFGALRLRLRPGHASYAFVAADGDVLDSGSVRCAR